jgi:pimeloyl-ACP methyl ester carboxylesterase
MGSTNVRKHRWAALPVVLAVLAGAMADADVVTDWNHTAAATAAAAELPPQPTYELMATVQTAVYEAVNAITERYPSEGAPLPASPGASVPAAVAAANREVLSTLVPGQRAAIDGAFQAAVAALPDGPARKEGIAVGLRAAASVLARRVDAGMVPESYRPRTTPGVYVPTVIPLFSEWGQGKPWLMTRPDQFRPGPPPSLTGALWARDYEEIKAFGARDSRARSAEQSAVARFWEATVPTIYAGVVESVTTVPGRDLTQNARLLAVLAQATNDALVAVFDAKYHYGFWRPVTAIRNGDLDGNDATGRDASWAPFIDTPLHPEYPCAHCILASTIGTVLEAEIGAGATPTLRTRSPTAPGVVRSWTRIDDFVQEVADARIYDGVHYRNSTRVGLAMGKQIGALAAARLRPPKELSAARLERASVDGVDLEYEIRGTGEPVVLIHNGVGVDWYRLLAREPALAGYRVLLYHRAGYAGSGRPSGAMDLAREAAHCRLLMRRLGIGRAHVVGHSSSALIALRLAADAPETVGSLALLEPALLAVPSPPLVREAVEVYRGGRKEQALDVFLRGTCGEDYRAALDRALPGAFAQAVDGADRFFGEELPALRAWTFGRAEAERIGQPVLAVRGAASGDVHRQRHQLLLEWLPRAEPFVLPDAGHLLHVQNPRGMAEGLASFFRRHPIDGRAETR